LPALGASCLSAVSIFVFQIVRRQPGRPAVIGLAIALICAGIAAITGEARDFFIAPALIPAVALIVCAGSLAVRRPFTGVLLNRVVGGPENWRAVHSLFRVYAITTAVAILINIVNSTLQAIFYFANAPIVLAIIHAGTAPAFATLIAATVYLARREIGRTTRSVS
jgi:hypothetical protein